MNINERGFLRIISDRSIESQNTEIIHKHVINSESIYTIHLGLWYDKIVDGCSSSTLSYPWSIWIKFVVSEVIYRWLCAKLQYSQCQRTGDCSLELSHRHVDTQIAKFTGPTWGPPGSCRPQMGPMLTPWTLLSGYSYPSSSSPS